MPPRTRRIAGFLAIAIGTVPAPLDSAVNIAFPAIVAAFGLAVEDIRWVVISYVLTHSSLMLVFGKLGDILGYRLIFATGLAVSAAAFTACSLATTLGFLLAGRVLQGVGIALILSCGPALATSLVDERQRTRALGIYAAIMAVGQGLGPLIGGFLVDIFGWSVVYWARVPLCLVGLALSAALPAGTPGSAGMRGFDGIGAFLLVTGLSSMMLTAAGHSTPLGASLQGIMAVLAAAAFALFVLRSRRHESPIIRLSSFADGRFLSMNLTSIAVNFAAFSIMLLVPFWLARTAGLDAKTGGIILALAPIGTVIGASTASRIVERMGSGWLAIAGMVLSIAGLATISRWNADSGLLAMGAALLVQGFGVGLFQVAYTDLVIATLPPAERGVAGSLTNVTRTIGVVGAATGLAAAHRHFEGLAKAGGASVPEAFIAGFQTTFAGTAAGLALVLVIVAWGLSKTRARVA